MEYVRQLVLTKNISVLWITHLFDEIEEDDNVTLIKTGKIIESGIVKNIIAKHKKENLVETFNYLVR